jgi:hypothetical protein
MKKFGVHLLKHYLKGREEKFYGIVVDTGAVKNFKRALDAVEL